MIHDPNPNTNTVYTGGFGQREVDFEPDTTQAPVPAPTEEEDGA